MFENFVGNRITTTALETIVRQDRVPQTLLFYGSEGVGKATLARRLAAVLVGDPDRIEQDDLSLPANQERIAERVKLPAEKRSEDPLFFSSHPDFATFPPDGPLRQISIQQMRLLKERAQYKPLKGSRRVFLIDQLDRANENAANSLLKTLEEPPDHLVLVATAENVYDLLPTIRSRSVQFHLSPLPREEMRTFVRDRGLDSPERRIALAGGSPGRAISIDLALYDQRRDAMLSLLGAASKTTKFSAWAEFAEKLAASRTEKLDDYLLVLYGLLEDLVLIQQHKDEIRNIDIRDRLTPLAERVTFDWIRAAVKRTDNLVHLLRRNIQKSIALDAMVLDLRDHAAARP